MGEGCSDRVSLSRSFLRDRLGPQTMTLVLTGIRQDMTTHLQLLRTWCITQSPTKKWIIYKDEIFRKGNIEIKHNFDTILMEERENLILRILYLNSSHGALLLYRCTFLLVKVTNVSALSRPCRRIRPLTFFLFFSQEIIFMLILPAVLYI